MFDNTEENHCHFLLYFSCWYGSKNEIKVKINKESFFIKNGKFVVFNPILKNDEVLNAIDGSALVKLIFIDMEYMPFELEIVSQHEGFFYFNLVGLIT